MMTTKIDLLLLFLIVSNTYQQQQQCPIGRLSLSNGRSKCFFAISSKENYFDAEIDCKMRAAHIDDVNMDNTFLVSIAAAYENWNVLG
jgi:hypothetical protein